MREYYTDTTRQSGWIRAFVAAVREIRPGLGQRRVTSLTPALVTTVGAASFPT